MAKSTRQYVFDGMEVLPEALAPFVEKRLKNALMGHWKAFWPNSVRQGWIANSRNISGRVRTISH